jgi:hypothetical protein
MSEPPGVHPGGLSLWGTNASLLLSDFLNNNYELTRFVLLS